MRGKWCLEIKKKSKKKSEETFSWQISAETCWLMFEQTQGYLSAIVEELSYQRKYNGDWLMLREAEDS